MGREEKEVEEEGEDRVREVGGIVRGSIRRRERIEEEEEAEDRGRKVWAG